MGQENMRLQRGEAPLAKTQDGLSKSQKPKSVLGNLLKIVARELTNIVLTWGLEKLLGVRAGSRGASKRQGLSSHERPGARPSFPQQE